LKKDPVPKPRNKWLAIAAVAAIIVIILALVLWPGSGGDEDRVTYTVRRRDLVISVLEGGDIVSTRSLEIKCEVEGRTEIISIVPDGSIVTEEDVRNGKVLVELDSADLVDKAAQQEITFQSASAAYTQAKESFGIQKNQNESNIKAGELRVKFARMDLEKYLGAPLAANVLAGEVNLSELSWQEMDEAQIVAHIEKIQLGGDAMQRIRRLMADIDLAGEEYSRAKADYEWSEKLGPNGAGYITRSELEADRLALRRRQVEMELARPALRLFLQYEFPKEAEKLISDNLEAGRELERIKARARSEMAQSEAELKSREARYNVQKDRLKKLREQIEHCVIRATKPGMVVYPSTAFRWRRSADKIEEGATVRERQVILTIPDPDSMAVNTKINEAAVHQVKPGQRVRIVPEPFPDMVVWGRLLKVAVLPDPAHPMFSADLKVFDSTILIDDPPPEIQPGMSAKVEIIIAHYTNVIAVPIQAVTTIKGKRACYVLASDRAEPRFVKTGQANDSFIHILEGLNVGDEVLLHPPEPAEAGEPPEPDLGEEAAPVEDAPPTEETNTALEAPPAPEPEAPTEPSAGEVDIDKMLENVPEEFRERAKQRWEEATPEERTRMMERFRQGRGEGGRPPEGGGRGGGEERE